jgi:hypothetical protein
VPDFALGVFQMLIDGLGESLANAFVASRLGGVVGLNVFVDRHGITRD